MKKYSYVTDMTPDKITLQNMEKKSKTTILFINTLKAQFITHMIRNTTKSFSDIVITDEIIENAIRSGKIDAEESNKRLISRKKENEVNNTHI
ncbi:dynactin subunit 1-like [Gossypium australe]|uniref:Dynactin subunit 1-like n=1 Tax=Gossypium australe TaxID=47621 RepID=A0A5B6V8L0_9ROSI|nr:dynactin subunit 1-like [Gossypium australe]